MPIEREHHIQANYDILLLTNSELEQHGKVKF